jgi:hypothetical protein
VGRHKLSRQMEKVSCESNSAMRAYYKIFTRAIFIMVHIWTTGSASYATFSTNNAEIDLSPVLAKDDGARVLLAYCFVKVISEDKEQFRNLTREKDKRSTGRRIAQIPAQLRSFLTNAFAG